MEISQQLAQDIVYEMKKIINKNINYIQTDGIILASTDSERIGQYHEGAELVFQTEKMLIIEYDKQYLGTRKGINLPVYFQNQIIGVIGISGEREEVESYGQIIKKMTEILIKDSYVQEKIEQELEEESLFLESLFFPNRSFSYTLAIPKLDLKEKARVLSIHLVKTEKNSFFSRKKLIDFLKTHLPKGQSYFMIKNEKIFILSLSSSRKSLSFFLEEFVEKFQRQFSYQIQIGIGSLQDHENKIAASFQEANFALEWCIQEGKSFVFYEDMKLELLLHSIPDKVKLHYQEQIFSSLTMTEKEEYKEIFLHYEKHNGSLEKISKDLFIHKNTLQYRLNRFFEKTGLDMRNYSDFCLLKLAFLLDY